MDRTMNQAIRVPAEGRRWLRGAGWTEGAAGQCGAPVLRVPAGRIFDAVDLFRPVGLTVFDYCVSRRRHVGPVLLDGGAGVLRFLVEPGLRPRLESLRAEADIPAEFGPVCAGADADIVIPTMVTPATALVRWLIVPRSELPRLTAVEDLIAGVRHHLASQAVAAGVPAAEPAFADGLPG